VRKQFDRLLEIAQIAEVIHNDHAYWLDCACVYEVRKVMLALGRRFANANILDAPEDVMHLSLAEIKQIGAGLAQGQPPNGQQALVSERKAELPWFAKIKPPLQPGTVPWIELTENEPMLRAGKKFMGVTMSGALAGRILSAHRANDCSHQRINS
jgi:hypothetical protein